MGDEVEALFAEAANALVNRVQVQGAVVPHRAVP